MVLCCGTYSDHQNTDVSAACQIPTVSTHISSGKHCVNGEIPRPQILLVTVEPDKPGGSFHGKGNAIWECNFLDVSKFSSNNNNNNTVEPFASVMY